VDEEGRERLAKVLAARGIASRREAERLVVEGHVEVNGQIASHPGHPVDPARDHIRVDGVPLPPAPRPIYLLLNKPKGYITGRNDPRGRRSVLELLGTLPDRVEPVGRLDFNTEGALLLTNDGDLAHALAHPAKGVPKRYLAKVYRTPSERTLARIEAGVPLEDGRSGPCKVRVTDTTDAENAWVEITVTEGKNRLVRRIFAAVGHPVSKLRRESFATLSVREMAVGSFRALTAEEVARLRDLAEGVPASEAGRRGPRRKPGFAKPDPKWIEKRTRRKKKKA